jgi:hypothetical protein
MNQSNSDILQELLIKSFWSEMNKVYTAIPCIVVNVQNDFKEQLVDVQPSLNIYLQNGGSKPRSVIMGVPVIQPATSTSALTMPINKGDTVLCVFSMRAIEIWQESDGKPSTPDNHAKFHEKDAFAIVGLFPRKKAINNPNKRKNAHSTQDLVLAHNIGKDNETEIRIKPNGDLIINSANKVEVNCTEAVVTAETSITFDTPSASFTGSLDVATTITAGTDVEAAGVSLVGHDHDVVGVDTGLATIVSNPPN